MATNPIHAFNLPSPYQTDLDELTRRQKMAELLQAQAFQPAEKFSYKGIEARVSPLSYLAKALQGYTSAKDQREILAERKALGERYRKEGMDDMTRYAEMAGKPAVAAVPGQDAFMPMTEDYEDRAMGGAPDFKLDAQGMVPAVDPVAARMRGQIDPAMIGQFKTPEMQRMALAAMLKQGELPAAFNLGAEETRFQPPVGGGAPVVVARGAAKPLPSPFAGINPKDFTQESLKAALKPDGTLDRTLLIPVAERATGNLAELAAENADRKSKGLPPLSIAQYREQIAAAGAPKVNVNTEKTYFDQVAQGLAKDDVGVISAGRSSPERIASARRIIDTLKRNPITGTGAEARLMLDKGLATAGLIDPKTTAATESLASALAAGTLEAIKSSGLGSGQGFTDKDREFLERAKSGNISINPATLLELAQLNEKAARESIIRANIVMQRVRGAPGASRIASQLEDIVMPPDADSGVSGLNLSPAALKAVRQAQSRGNKP